MVVAIKAPDLGMTVDEGVLRKQTVSADSIF